MVTFDDDFLSEEHLDNIDNDNEGDDGVDESSSNNEEINKINSLSSQIATLCFLFWNSMRYKSFKFDINSIYESNKFNSIRLFFVIWIENVNVVVKTNLIHFNSMPHNFDVWIRP